MTDNDKEYESLISQVDKAIDEKKVNSSLQKDNDVCFKIKSAPFTFVFIIATILVIIIYALRSPTTTRIANQPSDTNM